MANVQYWDDTLGEKIESIQFMLDRIPSIRSSAERASSVEMAKEELQFAMETEQSYKAEIRLVTDDDVRRRFESDLATKERQLRTLQDLVRNCGVDNDDNAAAGGADPDMAGDSTPKEASRLQDKMAADSVISTKLLLMDEMRHAIGTTTSLQEQLNHRDQIQMIVRELELDRVDREMTRTQKLMKLFRRRIAAN